MQKINLLKLVTAILRTAPGCPIKYHHENQIAFRGGILTVNDGRVTSDRIKFSYTSPESFIRNLMDWGLMLNQKELTRILGIYYLESF